jgi:atypical dual specificity phosphatase
MNSYDKIITGLYVGDEISPRVAYQRKENLTHVISLTPVTKTLKRFLRKKSIFHYTHVIPNDIDEDIIQHFRELYPLISDIMSKDNSKLLIHCELGRSRSVGIALLILMKKYRYNFDQGYELIKLKRDVELNEKFYEKIKNFKRRSIRIK